VYARTLPPNVLGVQLPAPPQAEHADTVTPGGVALMKAFAPVLHSPAVLVGTIKACPVERLF
jgi:hypothetical protein